MQRKAQKRLLEVPEERTNKNLKRRKLHLDEECADRIRNMDRIRKQKEARKQSNCKQRYLE